MNGSTIIKDKQNKKKNTKNSLSEKKNLLIYAHYYHPDVASTGQILRELAEGMLDTFNVTVICVVPSYTGDIAPMYKKQKYYNEIINGVHVLRVRVPEFSKSNKMSRVKNILAYFFRSVIATFKVGKQDYVYTISQPPILGGMIGVIGKYIKNAKFIYNIQDFNPEQIISVGYSKNLFVLGAMMFLDKLSCKISDKIIIVGRDMIETLKVRFTGKEVPKYAFINNWIDDKEIYPLESTNTKIVAFKKRYGLEKKFIIMYSGNIGLYYDLENLMKVIKKFKDEDKVVFAFVGSGSVKDKLVLYKEKHCLDNVIFIPYQEKKDLNYSLNAGDIHWVVNAEGIKGVSVPSKLYGVMAAGKPVLGVLEKGSEARIIIEETGCGSVVEPGDYVGVEKMIQKFIDDRHDLEQMGEAGREYLVNNMAKDISVKKYIEEIQSC